MSSVVNCTNILRAVFAPILLFQKITNCKHMQSCAKHFRTYKVLVECQWNWHLLSISSTFYKQILHQYFCTKKLQSQTVTRENLPKHFPMKKGSCKMLLKLTPDRGGSNNWDPFLSGIGQVISTGIIEADFVQSLYKSSLMKSTWKNGLENELLKLDWILWNYFT